MDINDAGKETCRVALAEIGAKLEKDKRLGPSIYNLPQPRQAHRQA